MRSHGWSRGIKLNKDIKKKYKNIDNKFLFINLVLTLGQRK